MGFLTGTALIAFLVSCWSYIKMYLEKIKGLFIIKVYIKDDLKRYCSYYFQNNYKISKTCSKTFSCLDTYIRPNKNRGMVVYKETSDGDTIFWKGWKPIFLTITKNKESSDTVYFSFIRWTFKVEDIIKGMEKWVNDLRNTSSKKSHNFSVSKYIGRGNRVNYHENDAPGNDPTEITEQGNISIMQFAEFLSWDKKDLGEPEPPFPMSLIALNEETKEAVDEIRRWKNSETWYKERNIPWKRGLALTGKPGNGKSTLARLLAIELNMKLNVFDISTMDNKEFQNYWKRSLHYSPAINLIEDIDAVFDGRKNIINPESGLTFDCLLNTIDGVESSDGILTIVTTNHIEKLDPAIGNINGDNISTRPGRIDRVVEMTSPDKEGRKMIADRILKDYPDQISYIVEAGKNDSGAQFQERCSRLALRLFWESEHD